MTGKFTKYLAYIFFIGIILIFVLNGADASQTWVPIVRTVAFVLAITCGIIYVAIIVYCIIENKKIDKLIDTDKYEELIAYSNKKLSKKALILENRKAYYHYLLLLSYLAKDEQEHIDEEFKALEGQEFMFPVISYWRVCYNFSKGNYEGIEDSSNMFKNSKEVARAPHKYSNLLDLLNALTLYSKGDINQSKEIIENLDTHNISMPCTIKSINIIKETKINENENIAE